MIFIKKYKKKLLKKIYKQTLFLQEKPQMPSIFEVYFYNGLVQSSKDHQVISLTILVARCLNI